MVWFVSPLTNRQGAYKNDMSISKEMICCCFGQEEPHEHNSAIVLQKVMMITMHYLKVNL